MHAFLTGSRAYGVPRSDSDIDVVIRCDEALALLLRLNSTANGDPTVPVKLYGGAGIYPPVNLILCTTDKMFHAWEQGTIELRDRGFIENRPIGRDEAIVRFTELRAAEGIQPSQKKAAA